jgi:hypothetical protein
MAIDYSGRGSCYEALYAELAAQTSDMWWPGYGCILWTQANSY